MNVLHEGLYSTEKYGYVIYLSIKENFLKNFAMNCKVATVA